MNYELLARLAQLRCADAHRMAAHRRLLRTGCAHPRPARVILAGAVRAIGYAALTLGDTLSDPH